MSSTNGLGLAHRTDAIAPPPLHATACLPAPVLALVADGLSDGWIALDADGGLHRIDRAGHIARTGALSLSKGTRPGMDGLIASDRWLYARRGDTVTVVDSARLAPVATLVEPLGNVVDAAALSGSLLAWITVGCHAVRVWDAEARECVASFGYTASSPTLLAAHPASGLIAVAGIDEDLTLFDLDARRAVARAAKVGPRPRALAWVDPDTLAWIADGALILLGREGASLVVRAREELTARDVARVNDTYFIVSSTDVTARPPAGPARRWRFAAVASARVSVSRRGALAVATADTLPAVEVHLDAGQDEDAPPPTLARIFHSESSGFVVSWGPSSVARWRPGEGNVTRRAIAPSLGAELSPDGRWLVVLRGASHPAAVVDVETWSERALPASALGVVLSPNGRDAALLSRGAPVLVDLERAAQRPFSAPLGSCELTFSADGSELYLFDSTGVIARCALDGTVLARVEFPCRWGYGNDRTTHDGGVRGVWPAPDGTLIAHVGTPLVDPGTYDNWDGELRGTAHELLLLDATTLATRRSIRKLSSAPDFLARAPTRDPYVLRNAEGVVWVDALREGARSVALAGAASGARLTVDPGARWLAFATPERATLVRAADAERFGWSAANPIRDVAVDARGGLYVLDALGAMFHLTLDEGDAR